MYNQLQTDAMQTLLFLNMRYFKDKWSRVVLSPKGLDVPQSHEQTVVNPPHLAKASSENNMRLLERVLYFKAGQHDRPKYITLLSYLVPHPTEYRPVPAPLSIVQRG